MITGSIAITLVWYQNLGKPSMAGLGFFDRSCQGYMATAISELSIDNCNSISTTLRVKHWREHYVINTVLKC